MPLLNYHMVRYASPALYTFELVVVAAVWVVVVVLWRHWGDPRPLAVYAVAGLYNTGIELLAQGGGVRAIHDAHLFGTIPVGYPWLPVLLGFFEGGVLLLVGYELLRGVCEGDRRARRVGLLITAALFVLIAVGSAVQRARLQSDPHVLTLTTRALYTPGSLVALALCYAVGIGYVGLARAGGPEARRQLLVWYAGIAAVAACWYTPAFLSGVRVIGALQNGTYVPVGMPAQLTVFYGYSIVFEAAGFYLPVYVIIRMLGLV